MPTTSSRPRIAYERHGASGPPVLFIMGLGMPGRVWRPTVDRLHADHRCCWYDHLGLGDSDAPAGRVSMASMADDALRVLDTLGWDSVHLVGVSMGGMIAQEVALRAQARLRSLTLVATHDGSRVGRLPTLAALRAIAGAVGGGRRQRVTTLERLLYPDDFLASLTPEQRRQSTAPRLAQAAPAATLLGHLRAVRGHRTRDRLHELRLPTLLVRPGRDILIRPLATDRLAQRLPHARVVRFDDAGHGVLFHKADELDAALRAHFVAAESG